MKLRNLSTPAACGALVLGAGALGVLVATFYKPVIAHAQAPVHAVVKIDSLKTVGIPPVKNLNAFLNNNNNNKANGIDPRARAAAVALGKALFWDQAAGSDGQACASCHFNAGADSRTFGQIDPGLRAVNNNPTPAFFGGDFSANSQLHVGDFPFSQIAANFNIVSSQGVFDTEFSSVTLTTCPADQPTIGNICDTGVRSGPGQGVFNFFGTGRNVEPRNTPTTINAVFNFRNFWDSRARNEFNGVNPLGDLMPSLKVWINTGAPGATPTPVRLKNNAFGPNTEDLRLENSSLASQSVGPPLSDMEMSFRDRTFPLLGRKLLALANALPGQLVDPNDSVLGNNKKADVHSRSPLKGIDKSYVDLIKAAFQDRWWNGGSNLPNGATEQMANNFSLFWGLAIQLYESTLVADNSLLDQAFDAFNNGTAGDPRTCGTLADPTPCAPGWTPQLQLGLNVFEGKGKCAACHGGPELTNAAAANVKAEKLERMMMGDGHCAVYDNGFYNTAVRRCVGDTRGNVTGVCDDAGLKDENTPVTNLLPMSLFFQLVVAGGDPRVASICAEIPEACVVPPVINQPGCTGGALTKDEPIAVVGSFKTPGLRNIALQAPFFHNGGELSLEQVVDFYNRGGNFAVLNKDNFDPNIENLNLNLTPGPTDERAALVALMNAMTDERVRCQAPPFDHPQLTVANLAPLQAVGANSGCTPLATFFDNLAKP